MGRYVYSAPPAFRIAAAGQYPAFRERQARQSPSPSTSSLGWPPGVNPSYAYNKQSPGGWLIRILGFGIAIAVGYKFVQPMFDEDYAGHSPPHSVRQEIIREHVSWWGWVCPECGRETRDLQIDHRVSRVRGGRNSRANYQVLCGRCNLEKGAKYSFWDAFLGRYADN